MSKVFEGHGYKLEYTGPADYEDRLGWKTAGSAGFDLVFAGAHSPGSHLTVLHTGIRIISCDPSLVGLLFVRSSLAIKHGAYLANGVGVIDSDYRDEVLVGLLGYSPDAGERIAQLVFTQFRGPLFSSDIQRTGGIGSTGGF